METKKNPAPQIQPPVPSPCASFQHPVTRRCGSGGFFTSARGRFPYPTLKGETWELNDWIQSGYLKSFIDEILFLSAKLQGH